MKKITNPTLRCYNQKLRLYSLLTGMLSLLFTTNAFPQQWVKINTPASISTMEKLFTVEKKTGKLYCASQNWDSILVSEDKGLTWKNFADQYPGGTIENLAVTSTGRVLMARRERNAGRVYVNFYVTDSLKNWVKIYDSYVTGTVKLYTFNNGLVAYTHPFAASSISVDDGETWSLLSQTFNDVAEGPDSSLYSVGYNTDNLPVVYKKLNNSNEWQPWVSENFGNHIKYIAVAQNGNIVIGGSGGNTFLSKNQGGFSPTDSLFSALYYGGGNQIIGVGNTFSSISKDGGATWKKIKQGDLGNSSVKTIYYSNAGDIYAKGNTGFFILNSDTNVVITPPVDSLGTRINHFKGNFTIYPNPASNYINIISNNIKEINKIEVYNINGVLVLTSTNTKNINISNLENGVYFIRVRGAKDSGKAVLRVIR
ncbi:MAG: T9SS type A sorting domain-containing protein [Bacteroidales bacterium]|nr:T9SS type A sorting domain-containing protein [Bacteroidales bacterium]